MSRWKRRKGSLSTMSEGQERIRSECMTSTTTREREKY